MEIGMDQGYKSKAFNTNRHEIGSSKQKFQSDDSDGSDLSYESSVTDEDDSNIGRIQFFKEQMARFFINYPELINKNIIEDSDKENESGEESLIKTRFNRNWESIAGEILSEAKESTISLQSLAKRISLYRYKIDQSDIIDLLLQQKTVILKEIEADILQKKNEANILGQNEKREKNAESSRREDNSYYSWRKRKEFELRLNRNSLQRSQSQPIARNGPGVDGNKSVKKFTSSLRKANGRDISKGAVHRRELTETRLEKTNRTSGQGMQQERVASNWRHLVNFDPKTEIGRQLSQEIKKNHSCSDDLGIKKTILTFLIRYKEMINNEIINKITLSQKIQKLYNDDAKELLMFYPSRTSNVEGVGHNAGSFKDNLDDKFLKLLREINEGPLMRYWRQLQENKI